MIKLSFRKGGDKTLYAVLKRSLLGKAWQVSAKNYCNARKSSEFIQFSQTKDAVASSTGGANGAERSGIRKLTIRLMRR